MSLAGEPGTWPPRDSMSETRFQKSPENQGDAQSQVSPSARLGCALGCRRRAGWGEALGRSRASTRSASSLEMKPNGPPGFGSRHPRGCRDRPHVPPSHMAEYPFLTCPPRPRTFQNKWATGPGAKGRGGPRGLPGMCPPPRRLQPLAPGPAAGSGAGLGAGLAGLQLPSGGLEHSSRRARGWRATSPRAPMCPMAAATAPARRPS